MQIFANETFSEETSEFDPNYEIEQKVFGNPGKNVFAAPVAWTSIDYTQTSNDEMECYATPIKVK